MVNVLGKAENLEFFNDRGILVYSFEINIDGYWSETTYNSRGSESTFKDSSGYWSEYTYDERGKELTCKDSKGYWREYTYDDFGNVLTYKDSGDIIERIKLFGVEYQTDFDRTTYELFGEYSDAKDFAETVVAIYLFSADFNVDSVCLEPTDYKTQYNYEDENDLYINDVIIETYIDSCDGLEALDNLIDSFVDVDDKLVYQAKLHALTIHINSINSEVARLTEIVLPLVKVNKF